MKPIKLGIIGTNFVSDWLCDAVDLTDGIENAAVYSRTREKGQEFAANHSIPSVYTDMEAFLSSDIDAVYIASPNFLHHDHAVNAARHEKHILLEKPAALDVAELDDIFVEADKNGVKVIEAMRPAHDPVLEMARGELGSIGTLRRAVFDFCQYSSRYDRFKRGEILNAFNPALGNAAVMDIGVYAIHTCVSLFGRPAGIFSKSVKLHNGMEGMGSVFVDYGEFQAEIVYSKITDSAMPSVITGEDGYIMLGKLSTMESLSVKKRGGEEKILSSGRFPAGGKASNMIYEVADFVKIVNGELSVEKFNENTRLTMEIINEIRRQNDIVFPVQR